MNIELKKSLSMLELSDLTKIIEAQETDIKLIDMDFNERLEFILTSLVRERENRLVNRLVRNAGFKYPMASIESLDYDSRQARKSTIINLAGMGFVASATNIIIVGPTGAGKTFLACALGIEACKHKYRTILSSASPVRRCSLGIEACKHKYRTLYIRMPDLMRYFEANRDNRMLLARYRKQLCNYQVLIIDEWLNYKVAENDAKVLYEIFDGRCEKRPTVFVGQYPQDEWYDRLGGGAQSESILDRIVYNAYTIPTGETNLRKIYETRKLRKLMTEIEK